MANVMRSPVCRTAPAVLLALASSIATASAQTQTPPPVPRDVRQPVALPNPQPSPAMTGAPPRDRVPPPRVGTAIVRGLVIDGITGKPLARARVRLQAGPAGPRDPVLTDASGVFEFTGLPSGTYGLGVDKSTYLASQYPEMGRTLRSRGQPIFVRDGQTVEDVTVRLFRGGAIAGRVFDAYGEPVDMAQVQILSVPRSGRPQMRGSNSTNDLGEFRVARLQPGRYLVRVRPQGGYDSGMPQEKPLPAPLPTYYPSVPSIANAQVVVVNRGETVSGLDITLGEAMPTIVTGMVLSADGQPITNGSIGVRLAGSEAFGFDAGGTGLRPDGSFRLTLPPGEYVLEARVSRQAPNMSFNPANEQFGVARITAAGGTIEGVAIMLGRGATASGRVIFEGSTPPPPSPGQANVPLYNPEGPGCRQVPAIIAADWTFKVEGLNGTCGASTQPLFGRWMLKGVMVRGQNLMDQMVTFEPGQHYSNVQIIVTDRRTQLDLQVTDDTGQPTRDYVAIAFSTDKERWAQPSRYVRTFSSSSPPPGLNKMGAPVPSRGGPNPATISVTTTMTTSVVGGGPPGTPSQIRVGPIAPMSPFSLLPPGDYYFIAVDDIELEDSRDPAIFERLVPNATRVTLSEEASVELTLRRFAFTDLIR
jgi:Carboxypeptidase regulatory-like domain